MTRLLELPAGECHVWVARIETTLPSSRVAAYEKLLTPTEDARYRRFMFEKHRHLFLLTRALVRTTLSRYRPLEPAGWRFRENAWGKPEIDNPGTDPLEFNLSNTEGLVVCSVTRDRAVGVDVEHTLRLDDPVAIADRFFSPREARELRALPTEKQRERFFAYWTLKESYIKARGMGLAIPLDQFSFILDESSERIGIEIDPRQNDAAEAWQFARIDIGEPHAFALAIKRGDQADFRIDMRDWT